MQARSLLRCFCSRLNKPSPFSFSYNVCSRPCPPLWPSVGLAVVCQCLHWVWKPETGHSFPDVAALVLNRGEGSLPWPAGFTCANMGLYELGKGALLTQVNLVSTRTVKLSPSLYSCLAVLLHPKNEGKVWNILVHSWPGAPSCPSEHGVLRFGFCHHNSLICVDLWCDLVLKGKTKAQKPHQMQTMWFCSKKCHTNFSAVLGLLSLSTRGTQMQIKAIICQLGKSVCGVKDISIAWKAVFSPCYYLC